ncbi:MAG TPA: type III secretion system export apparatus subunit SctT [Dokdonella sp.]
MPFEHLQGQMLAIALTLPRIAAAFLIVPLMTGDTVPALVRNSFFVSLAIVACPIAFAAAPGEAMMQSTWALIILKEVFVGTAIGFCFGAMFWALGSAGNVIDVKVGSSMANVMDPISGHQTSLTGLFLGQLGAWLFMATGAFTMFIDILLTSYRLWPVANALPPLHAGGVGFFASQFGFLMTAVLMFSAPALIVTSLLDIALGLVNRYAQQLNVFSLAMPMKAWLATWVLLLALGAIVEVVVRSVAHNTQLLDALGKML